MLPYNVYDCKGHFQMSELEHYNLHGLHMQSLGPCVSRFVLEFHIISEPMH